jgi:NADH-quinone oxidoreductase subunit L
LVGFWNTRSNASLSALKALFYNRVGDIGILLGLSILFFFFRSIDYSSIVALTPYIVGVKINLFGVQVKVLSLVGVLFLLGVIGKSAQLGLHA